MMNQTVKTKARPPAGSTNRTRARMTSLAKSLFKHLVLIAVSLTILFPIMWMVSSSLKPSGEEFGFPPKLIPDPVVWQNYPKVFEALPFGKFLLNSITIAGLATLGQVLTGALVGFAFAQLRFPGRNLLFIIVISTVMLPDVVTLVPQFILFRRLGWVDTILPLVVPAWFGGRAFYIFLARQYFTGIPHELIDAGRVDGASTWRIWWSVVMPMSVPLLVAMGLVRFLTEWNDFMGPLIYLNTMENRTLAVGLFVFLQHFVGEWNLLMAAATITSIPVILLFLFTQRYFVEGISVTGFAGR